MTPTWSTASSSMCWVSSINSSTSRNISVKLTGPRSRLSRGNKVPLLAVPTAAHRKHKPRNTDSCAMPDIFPSLPPSLSTEQHTGVTHAGHTAGHSWIRFIWKVWGAQQQRWWGGGGGGEEGGGGISRIRFNGVEKVHAAFRDLNVKHRRVAFIKT